MYLFKVGSQIKFADQDIISIPYNFTKPYKDLVDEFIDLFTREEDPINFGALYFDEPGQQLLYFCLLYSFIKLIKKNRSYWSFIWSLFSSNECQT